MPSNEQRRANAKRKLERQIARRAERTRRRRRIAVVATVIGVVVVIGGIYLIATSGGEQEAAAGERANEKVDKPKSIPVEPIAKAQRPKPLPATVDCQYKPAPAAKPAKRPSGDAVPARGTVAGKLRTSAGELNLTLDRSLAPCAVNSFVSLSGQGFFDDTSCHRLTVTGLQVLQCGDPSGTGSGGPGYSFADEVFPQLKYGRGTLAMANSGPDTNGSQFFIVYGSAAGLPPQFTVFGSIDAESLKKVDEVARAGTIRGTDPSSGQPTPGDGRPKRAVTIEKASIVA